MRKVGTGLSLSGVLQTGIKIICPKELNTFHKWTSCTAWDLAKIQSLLIYGSNSQTSFECEKTHPAYSTHQPLDRNNNNVVKWDMAYTIWQLCKQEEEPYEEHYYTFGDLLITLRV